MSINLQLVLAHGQAVTRRNLQSVLSTPQLISLSYLDLPLDQILSGNHFRDGMLNLQTRIHFHKVKGLIGAVKDKLHSPCAHVVDGLGCRHRLFSQLLSQLFAQIWSRCLFNHLLVSTLDAAVSLKQVDTVSVSICKHLNLNVTRADAATKLVL